MRKERERENERGREKERARKRERKGEREREREREVCVWMRYTRVLVLLLTLKEIVDGSEGGQGRVAAAQREAYGGGDDDGDKIQQIAGEFLALNRRKERK